jgi:hypothetical protein
MHRIMISALLHMLKAASGFAETTAFGLFQLVSGAAGWRAGTVAMHRPGNQSTGGAPWRMRSFALERQGLCRLHLYVNMPIPSDAFPLPSPS